MKCEPGLSRGVLWAKVPRKSAANEGSSLRVLWRLEATCKKWPGIGTSFALFTRHRLGSLWHSEAPPWQSFLALGEHRLGMSLVLQVLTPREGNCCSKDNFLNAVWLAIFGPVFLEFSAEVGLPPRSPWIAAARPAHQVARKFSAAEQITGNAWLTKTGQTISM